MEKSNFKGFWVPAEIWERKDLTVKQRVILARILSLDRGDGCFASNDYLAKDIGTTRGSIATLLSRFRKLGLLENVGFDGRTRFCKTKVGGQKQQPKRKPLSPEDDVSHEYPQEDKPAKSGSKKNGGYSRHYSDPRWYETRNRIYLRDNCKCKKCGTSSGQLHAHHLYYVANRLPWEYPDSAMITLCNACHKYAHVDPTSVSEWENNVQHGGGL